MHGRVHPGYVLHQTTINFRRMKYNYNLLRYIILIYTILATNGCSKDDSRLLRNEALIYQMTTEISADSIESYVTWLQDMGTRFALSEERRKVATGIMNKFKQFGYTGVKLDSFWLEREYRDNLYKQWQYNVIATLEPAGPSDSVSVMGAHYDNILGTGDPFLTVPGANDNASGIAAALEVARIMKKTGFIPSDTIKFIAFGAEELGLHGSNNYAVKAAMSGMKIKFMLNNDMIAYEPDDNKKNWFVNIIDYDNSHFLRKEAETLCSKFTNLNFLNDNSFNRQSDSFPFYLNGYKALFFYSNKMDPNYHSPEDLATYCNFTYCREITVISCALLVNKN